jgi:hypothetical protein
LAYECPAGITATNAKAVLAYLFREEVPDCPAIGTRSFHLTDNYDNKETDMYLGDNYPDPFTGVTVIPYCLPDETEAKLIISDALGKHIAEFDLYGGKNTIEIDTKNWADGIYLYGLSIDNIIYEYKKMIKANE